MKDPYQIGESKVDENGSVSTALSAASREALRVESSAPVPLPVEAPLAESQTISTASLPSDEAREECDEPTAKEDGTVSADVQDVEMEAHEPPTGSEKAAQNENALEPVELKATASASGGSRSAELALVDPLQPPVVKKRRTKNFKLREHMEKTRGTLQVSIEPFVPETFDNWDAFCQSWAEYMVKTKTLYRRRSSCSTSTWNSKGRFKKYPVPEQFPYATMAYWCTHGCLQPSRGTGVRAHLHNRYTGCSARITAEVVYAKRANAANATWFVRVRNQILTHNHLINDEIYKCYTSNSSVPDEMLLGALEESSQSAASSASLSLAPSSTPSIQSFGADSTGSSGLMSTFDASDHGAFGFEKSSLVTTEQMQNLIAMELKPLITELERSSSELFGRRLRELSKLVKECTQKWQKETVQRTGVSSPTALLPPECEAGGSSSCVVLDFTKNVTESEQDMRPRDDQAAAGSTTSMDVHVL